VQSCFVWEGKTQTASESLLVCKSRLPLMGRIIERVKALHSYTVPEVIAMPIVAGLPDYLEWVRKSVEE
jgi:periplasmic divalent cation tolerance protein